jgi:hypothetical protein
MTDWAVCASLRQALRFVFCHPPAVAAEGVRRVVVLHNEQDVRVGLVRTGDGGKPDCHQQVCRMKCSGGYAISSLMILPPN